MRNRDAFGEFVYNGIDRIDSKIGYLPNNVTPCCKWCNKAKSNTPHDEWVAYLDRLVRHRGGGVRDQDGNIVE